MRVGATLPALRLLTRLRHMSSETTATLTRAYRVLRQVEHRVQMVADRQTHALPATERAFAALGTFMGFATPEAFAETLLPHLLAVQALYDGFFAPDDDVDSLEVGALGAPPPETTVARLADLGFTDPMRVVEIVRRWMAGRPRALRSERSRALLDAVLPNILAAIAAQPQPDQTFARFDHFISRLPAGIQLLSLFRRNTALIDRIAVLLGAAPGLSDHLAGHPGALEGLLGSEEVRADPARMLRRQLVDAMTLEDTIALTRHFVSEEHFRVGVAQLEGRMDVDAAGLARAALADAALSAILGAVVANHTDRYGWLRGIAFAIVLLGKGGGREMMPGSDLDLMVIYDRPETVEESQGPRPLAPSQWVGRLVTAVTGALTAQGVEGPMYRVDMRLRPSGNQGPVAVSLGAFRAYHAEHAWTWEQMALTRARVVAGVDLFRPVVEAALSDALRPPAHAGCLAPGRAGDAAPAAARPSGAWALGREAAAGRTDGGGVRHADPAARPLRRAARAAQHDHPHRARQPCRSWRAARRGWRYTDRGRSSVADDPEHAAADRGAGDDARGGGGLGSDHPGRDRGEDHARPAPADGSHGGTGSPHLHPAYRRSGAARRGAQSHPPERTSIMSANEGDTAPDFEMPASGGRTVRLEDYAGKPFLLYFYPKADTPGCTKEACAFQEALPQLGHLGLDVIGVSKDPMRPIEKFAAKYNLTFPLASDETTDVTERYGCWAEKSMYGKKYMGIERTTFLIDKTGKIARAWRRVSVPGHAADVLKATQALV